MIQPTEITKCKDTGMHTASYEFYSGIREAERRELKQTTDFADVRRGTHFIVCCGDVMLRLHEQEYPEINRRDF